MFNLLVGRELQSMMGQKPQQCFLMPILVGTDGVQKMSKSLGNYVALEEEPNSMYGKLMSLPDDLIVPYFDYLTDAPEAEIVEMSQALQSDSVNPMELKKRLAREITAVFHDQPKATNAQEHFEQVVQRRALPDDIPEFQLGSPSADEDRSLSRLLVSAGMASSNGEAKRLINQRAVQIIRNPDQITTLNSDSEGVELQAGDVIKVGRRRFVRLTD